MNKNLINIGFIAAGLMNIGGVLIFSRGFTFGRVLLLHQPQELTN